MVSSCYPFNPPGVPSISELTFSATTRTLTCISTGGPATNVTWRMGGSELTVDGSMYQFMQTLTEKSTATYTNILTIVSTDLTTIIGSNFTCEVENSRGTATMNITIPCKNNVVYYLVHVIVRLCVTLSCQTCVDKYKFWEVIR